MSTFCPMLVPSNEWELLLFAYHFASPLYSRKPYPMSTFCPMQVPSNERELPLFAYHFVSPLYLFIYLNICTLGRPITICILPWRPDMTIY